MSLKFGWYKTPVPGDREDKKDSACTDHFTRYARHEVYVQDDLDVEHDLIGRRKRGIGST